MRIFKVILITIICILVFSLFGCKNTTTIKKDQTESSISQTNSIKGNSKESLVEENERLRTEISRLKDELHIVKKNYDYLSNETMWCINLSEPDYTPEEAEKIIKGMAIQVINALEKKDFKTIAKYTHPEKGLRFTSSSNVTSKDIIFNSEKMRNFEKDNELYIWGKNAGIGDDIKLKPIDFYNSFIYDQEYSQCEVIYNYKSKGISGNHYLIYNGSIIVDYIYIGSESANYLDGSNLKIVYQKCSDGNWYITGIINSQKEI